MTSGAVERLLPPTQAVFTTIFLLYSYFLLSPKPCISHSGGTRGSDSDSVSFTTLSLGRPILLLYALLGKRHSCTLLSVLLMEAGDGVVEWGLVEIQKCFYLK